jgi:hypothetical protein
MSALLGSYTTLLGIYLVAQEDFLTVHDGTDRLSSRNVSSYQAKLRNIPEERGSQLQVTLKHTGHQLCVSIGVQLFNPLKTKRICFKDSVRTAL